MTTLIDFSCDSFTLANTQFWALKNEDFQIAYEPPKEELHGFMPPKKWFKQPEEEPEKVPIVKLRFVPQPTEQKPKCKPNKLHEIHWSDTYRMYRCCSSCDGHQKVLVRSSDEDLKQYHWVSGHSRFRNGQWEEVSGHYRITRK